MDYFGYDAKEEFQVEIDAIIEDIKLNMKSELAHCMEFEFVWDEYSQTMNASASKNNNGGTDSYIIKINLWTPIYMVRLLNERLTDFDPSNKKDIIHTTVSHILSFIMWHEYYHIVLGHCTIPKYNNEMNEKISKSEGSFERQQFEVMCDMLAARKFASGAFIVAKEKDNANLIQFIFVILFIYFYENENITLKNNIIDGQSYSEAISEKRTHPFITFRFAYIVEIIEQEISRYLEYENFDEIHDAAISTLDFLGYSDWFRINPYDDYYLDFYNKLKQIDLEKLSRDTTKTYFK